MTDYNEPADEFAPAAPEAPANPPQTQSVPPAAQQTAAEPESKQNPYDSIIEQQTEQIAALIEQNKSLTDQITQLIHSGAQIGQAKSTVAATDPMGKLNTASMEDDADWSLESLAKDIGKRERH